MTLFLPAIVNVLAAALLCVIALEIVTSVAAPVEVMLFVKPFSASAPAVVIAPAAVAL